MNKLQTKLLAAFSAFHDICTTNGLTYIASGGTLLGAVRHKGFIPWDDDIDVWMPRPDYEKLKDVMKRHPHKIYEFETPGDNTGGHYYAMGKFYDTSTTVVEKTKFNVRKGIYIDVFPLDGLGRTEAERDRIYKRLHFRNLLMASRISVPRKERSAIKNLAIYASSLIPESILNTEKVIERFDKACKKTSYENSEYVGVLMGSYGMRDVIPKKWLENPALYDFESIRIYGVKNYDEYLTYIYGDWRKLPPKEKQVSLHDFEYLDLDHGYIDFIQE